MSMSMSMLNNNVTQKIINKRDPEYKLKKVNVNQMGPSCCLFNVGTPQGCSFMYSIAFIRLQTLIFSDIGI